mmetsp:Transcript_106759/g.340862  ORF Transcript_106759/g.340862 Transcript_106759/m.340862 type:complete len:274 (-) Transcript_106759:1031-1852(-)
MAKGTQAHAFGRRREPIVVPRARRSKLAAGTPVHEHRLLIHHLPKGCRSGLPPTTPLGSSGRDLVGLHNCRQHLTEYLGAPLLGPPLTGGQAAVPTDATTSVTVLPGLPRRIPSGLQAPLVCRLPTSELPVGPRGRPRHQRRRRPHRRRPPRRHPLRAPPRPGLLGRLLLHRSLLRRHGRHCIAAGRGIAAARLQGMHGRLAGSAASVLPLLLAVRPTARLALFTILLGLLLVLIPGGTWRTACPDPVARRAGLRYPPQGRRQARRMARGDGG